jgi:hydrogenase maturation factor HypF (carbamoyltransferase family)
MLRRAIAPAAAAARRYVLHQHATSLFPHTSSACSSFATESSTTLVDFDYLRGKAMSDSARATISNKQAEFNKRVSAVKSAADTPTINWDHFKAALPEYNIEKLQVEFEKYLASIPAISYDEATDKAAHQHQESQWESFAAFAGDRLEELATLKTEAEDHKLHEYYTLNRTFQRFDGLLEKEWLEWRNMSFHQNLRSFNEVPEELTEAHKAELGHKLAEKAGVTPAMLGLKK